MQGKEERDTQGIASVFKDIIQRKYSCLSSSFSRIYAQSLRPSVCRPVGVFGFVWTIFPESLNHF